MHTPNRPDTTTPAAKLLHRQVVISAPTPPNETARLKALGRYAVLDTPPEAAFDRITRWAARRFDAPITLVSLVDRDRQWFKSCVGMEPAVVDREIAFCAHVILSHETLIVPDTMEDARFRDNPQVTGAPFIRFYAGAPLVTSDGFCLGTLCVIDTKPRRFSPEQAADLQEFAATVMETLEARRTTAPLVAAIESTASGVVICDPGQPGTPIVSANPAFYAMTGYRPEEVLGRSCRFLQGPETDPATVQQMRTALANRQPFRGVLRNYRKNGTPFWNALYINPVFDDLGGLVSFVGVQVDTTSQVEALEQARESAARLALAQQVAGLGSWECAFTAAGELDATTLVWSKETYRLFDVDPGKTEGLWAEFFRGVHPDDCSAVQAALGEAVRNRGRYAIDHRLVKRDGTQRVVHEEAEIIFDEATGEPRRMVGTVQDITERIFAADIARHLTEARELPEMLRRCTQSMVEHLGAAFARVWTLNEREHILELRASSGLYTHLNGAHGRIPVGQFKIGRIASERMPHLTNQVIGDPRVPEQAWAREQGLVGFAGYPLIVDDRLVGVMGMFSCHPLSQKTLDAMALVASHIALGIERKSAETAVAQMAAIVKSSGDAIIGQTLDGVIISWNQGAEALYGYTEAEAVGQSSLQLIVPPERHDEENDAMRRTAAGEHMAPFETIRTRKGGAPVHVSLAVSAIQDAAGAIVATSMISRDITERKAADDALRISEQNYRAFFDANPLPSWVFDRHTLAFLEVNPAAVAHYGYSREEFLSMTILGVRPPGDIPGLLAKFPALGSGQVRSQPTWHRKKDGTLIEVEISGDEISLGGRTAILTVVHDVTERRRTELALRESEATFSGAFTHSPIGAALASPKGRWLRVNPAFCQLIGYSEAELLRRTIRDITHPEDAEIGREKLRHGAENGTPVPPFEKRYLHADGHVLNVLISSTLVRHENGEPSHWVTQIQDITERKRAEQELRWKTAFLEALVDSSADGIVVSNSEPKLLLQNQRSLDLWQIPAHLAGMSGSVNEERFRWIIGMTADPKRFREKLVHLQAHPDETSHDEVTLKSGTVLDFYTAPVLGQDDTYYGRIWTYRDITDRKRIEESLRESEARYAQIAANIPGIVYQLVLRPDGGVEMPFVSQGCRDLHGVEPEEMQRDASVALNAIHPDDRESYRQCLATSVTTLAPMSWLGRIRRYHTSEIRHIQLAAKPTRKPNGDIVWDGLILDITDRKQAEENLRAKEEAERTNKEKSKFLSRMSHELRTPLNAILGFGQVLAFSDLKEQDALALGYILKGGQHLLSLIDEVLDLSRAESGELHITLGEVDAAEVAGECVGLVTRLAEARRITCTVKNSHGPVILWCDEQRLRQTLLNLLSNAIKYNREGGQIFVSFERMPANRLRLNVADTGPGISPEGMDRLFVPFERLEYENGEVEGTGLGLVVSRRIAEAMDGSIGVESELGHGSTFWIELPLIASQAAFPIDLAQLADPAVTSLEVSAAITVLYIEDNLSNLQVMQMLLARCRPHWKFTSACDGRKGLEQARQHPPELILLDLQLPGMSGEEVLDELRRDSATLHIPVIVLSADATAHSREHLMKRGADAYVSKPFQAGDLLELLDDALKKTGVIL